MIKVQAYNHRYPMQRIERRKILYEMRDWCREQFGKNPHTGPRIWVGTIEAVVPDHEIDDPALAGNQWLRWLNRVHVPTFYFIDEKHAAAFLLRWG